MEHNGALVEAKDVNYEGLDGYGSIKEENMIFSMIDEYDKSHTKVVNNFQ
jgi:hypothetical protein